MPPIPSPLPTNPAPGPAVTIAVDPGAGPLWRAVIYGAPVAQKRPRFARRGNFVKTYSDQDTEAGRMFLELREAWGAGRAPLTGALSVFYTFGLPIPKATSKKHRDLMLAEQMRPAKKPDWDNLAKFIQDCGNGLLWDDDSQICLATVRKIYAEQPFTAVEIWR